MSRFIKEQSANGEREFLDITGEKDYKGIEEIVLVAKRDNSDQISVTERKVDGGQGHLPPWKRRPAPFDDHIFKRAKQFLSLCETVGNERVSEVCNEDKQVIMNVHTGVFDVHGNLPESASLSNGGVVDVPDRNLENVQQDQVCQIELDSDSESDIFEDDISGPLFNYDPNSKSSLDEQKAIYNMLHSNKHVNKGSNHKDLVQVISSKDNE